MHDSKCENKKCIEVNNYSIDLLFFPIFYLFENIKLQIKSFEKLNKVKKWNICDYYGFSLIWFNYIQLNKNQLKNKTGKYKTQKNFDHFV